jgi:mycothiol system anti-sigma-R factor
MKGCDGCIENIPLYLDEELRGQELVEFRAHLEHCAACRQELAADEELTHLLHRSRPLYFAPDALRDRVLEIGEPSLEPLLGLRKKCCCQ